MKEKVIFFGNGMLADYVLSVLEQKNEVIFHVRTKDDLKEVSKIKAEHPEVHGVLASFGVIIPKTILNFFEPEGILNVHPSLLPLLRGASPIESAILNGDQDFSVSVMKLVKEMDAGPIYWQTTLNNLPLSKKDIYEKLALAGAEWVNEHLTNLPEPTPQDEKKATYCGKLTKEVGLLKPETDSAELTFRKIVAFQSFPKPKYTFCGRNCIILEAHLAKSDETTSISMICADGGLVVVDRLQPEGRKPMSAKAFLNGYQKV